MQLMQVRDNDDNSRTIFHDIQNVTCVEMRGFHEILYITSDKPLEVMSINTIPNCRITIRGSLYESIRKISKEE